MKQQSPIGLAFAGCGSVFGAYLPQAQALEQKGLARVAALHDLESQRERVCALAPGAEFCSSYEALLARSDVSTVIILAPIPEHSRMALAALRAGKHVLVEKPMATNLEDAKQLVETARQSPGLLVCAPFTVLSPTFQKIGRLLRKGNIGRVLSARARYGWAGPDWNEWFYQPGGGAIFDLSSYNLTTLTGWLGPVKRVTAMTGVAIPERVINGRTITVKAEDNAQLLLDFGNGCFACVTTGFTIQQYRGPAVELYGSEGVIQMLGDDWDPDGFEMWLNSAGCWQLHKESHPDWPWTDGLRHMVDCINSGAKPLITPEHAYHVLEIMLRAQEAGRDGVSRAVNSTFALLDFEPEAETEAAHRIHDRTRKE